MCNLSEEIYEKGFQDGIAQGVAICAQKLLSERIYGISDLAEMFELPESEIRAILARPTQQALSAS